MDERSRLRLRLPNGLEVEAEGLPDFVRTQIQELLGVAAQPQQAPAPGPVAGPVDLEVAVHQDGADLKLRSVDRSGSPQDACLMLIMASEKLLGLNTPTAAQLARWLRRSGYPIKRIDRSLSEALKAGQVLASGSRRSRRYELSAKGRLHALLAAERAAKRIRQS